MTYNYDKMYNEEDYDENECDVNYDKMIEDTRVEFMAEMFDYMEYNDQ